MNKVKADFRPLTYQESVEGRPLLHKVGNFWYEFYPMSATSFAAFWTTKDLLISSLNKACALPADSKDAPTKSLTIVTVLSALIRQIWMSKYETAWGKFKRLLFGNTFKKFHDFFIKRTPELFEFYENILSYNSRVFFLLKQLQNYHLFQESRYFEIGFEHSVMDMNRIKYRGSLFAKPGSWLKKARSATLN